MHPLGLDTLPAAEVRAKKSSKQKLIPRPQGQAGRFKNRYNLQAEMQLSGDSERFQSLSVGGLRFAQFYADITAIGSTEGADEKFPVWDAFKEFLGSRSVLHGFG
jgi:hypothetical protein